MSNSVEDLMVAYHLIRRTEALTAERSGHGSKAGLAKSKSAKDWLEEDEALLSGQMPEAQKSQAVAQHRAEPADQRIYLSDLIRRLQEAQKQAAPPAPDAASQSETTLEYTSVQTDISLEYRTLTPVEGLVRRNQNLAETDRYQFDFTGGDNFKITDKWSNKSTTIWGDPHVDVSDVEGSRDGEFSDLKSSDTHTTLQLQDGTRVTFTARDNGIIEAVDIFKGNQHLQGLGSGSKDWQAETGLFATPVQNDGQSAASALAQGDVVRAGGDGTDWFDTAGHLVWGKITGPDVTARPSYVMQMSVSQTLTQVSFQQTTINRQA